MSGILGVGIATLDIVNEVARTPGEDEEVRALAQRRVRGGNVTNTLVVLARLGHRCAWAGTWAEEPDARVILDDLARHGIDVNPSLAVSGGKVPTSYVTLSRENGARTIVHYRDLPEYPAEAFLALPHRAFRWIHFEGRAVEELGGMLRHLHDYHPALPRSLEVEKPRPGIEALFPLVPLIVFSPVYARHWGFEAPEPFLRAVRETAPEAVLVCTWGEAGAWALLPEGTLLHAPAHPPARVVDTLGAGDTFNAGLIHARLQGLDWPQALDLANRLAGYKCGLTGFEGVEAAFA